MITTIFKAAHTLAETNLKRKHSPIILTVLACLISFFSYAQSGNTYSDSDKAIFKNMVNTWQTTWNNHQPDSMAALFANNVDYITRSGIWYKGKAETIHHISANQQSIFKSSTLTIDSVIIKYIKPDVAIIFIGWGLSGDFHHNGTPSAPRHGIYTWVLLKQDEWHIVNYNNVDIVTPL